MLLWESQVRQERVEWTGAPKLWGSHSSVGALPTVPLVDCILLLLAHRGTFFIAGTAYSCRASGLACLRHLLPCVRHGRSELLWKQLGCLGSERPLFPLMCTLERKMSFAFKKPKSTFGTLNPQGFGCLLLEWKTPGCQCQTFSWLRSLASPFHLHSPAIS